jgi:type IV pilus assembly protein PilE
VAETLQKVLQGTAWPQLLCDKFTFNNNLKHNDALNVMIKNSLSQHRGFTLIEVMITVVIVAILAAVALPSYTRYVMRAKRSAAQAEMMDIANRQQQFLMANRNYADKDTLAASGYNLPPEVAAHYGYTITLPGGLVPGYVLTFTPTGTQEPDGDLTLDNQGVKTPADKW